MSDNEVSLKEYMQREFKHINDAQVRLDEKIESHHKEISEKLDPVVAWKSEAQGSIKALKWLVGVGLTFLSLGIALIGVYLAFKGLKP